LAGALPGTPQEEISAPPDHLAALREPTCKGRGRREKRKGQKEKEKDMMGESKRRGNMKGKKEKRGALNDFLAGGPKI